MIGSETRIIDGETFEIRQLGFTASLAVFTHLTKTIGPDLAALLGAAPSIEALRKGQIDTAAASKALGDLLGKLEARDIAFLCKAFEACQWVDPESGARPVMRPDVQEKLFGGGRLMLCFKWLAACIEVNFADFFGAMGLARGVAPSPSAEAKG